MCTGRAVQVGAGAEDDVYMDICAILSVSDGSLIIVCICVVEGQEGAPTPVLIPVEPVKIVLGGSCILHGFSHLLCPSGRAGRPGIVLSFSPPSTAFVLDKWSKKLKIKVERVDIAHRCAF